MNATAAPASPARDSGFGGPQAWLRALSGRVSRGPADELPRIATRPPAHCHGDVRVLVVDDNPVNLMLMTAHLELRGLSFQLAADGAQAVAMACERTFDLILMDLQMPVLDGIGAAMAIRRFEAQSSQRAVPIVAYSTSTPSAAFLARHGINGSLSKPCGDRELEDCMVRWCPDYRSDPDASA